MKKYKIWSEDLGYSEEDAYNRTPKHDWYDLEDTIGDLLDEKYSDWEYPESGFSISGCEIDENGEKIGDVQTFSVDIDYSPNFYLSKNED